MTLMTTQANTGLPPPHADLLLDDARPVGWVRGDRVGFIGFGDVHEAAWAAWMADLALTRREARRDNAAMPSTDAPRLAVGMHARERWITGDGRRLARLIAPGGALPIRNTPKDAFAIEITLAEAGQVAAWSAAQVMYRGLRGSGLPWRLHVRADQLAPTTYLRRGA